MRRLLLSLAVHAPVALALLAVHGGKLPKFTLDLL